jgi:putative transposase
MGAFWEDCYHSTAIATDEHLHRGQVYIDLNMVRAAVVSHPGQCEESGFLKSEIRPSVTA